MTNPNTNTTNVPTPTFGPQGFILPPESAILAGVQQDINAAFGGGLNPGLNTPQGQLASSETAVIGDANAMFLFFTNQVDPAFSSGRMQDAIARIYFISRIPGAPTVQPCICNGLPNVIIPVGTLIQDQNNQLLVSQQQGVLDATGNATIEFAYTVNGPTAAPVTTAIYQSIFGWDSVTPTGGAALGVNVESRDQFELRRSQSTAINSSGQLPSILGAVLAVPNVLDAFVTENNTTSPATIGGVSVLANSIYVCVLGGIDTAVAKAIWSRKGPGCNYTGTTTVAVVDPSPQYLPNPPSYNVTFQRPTTTAFAVLVYIKNNVNVPTTALAQIQNSVISAFAGLDGGSRARIGSTVFASRYYAGIANLGQWAEVVRIQLGISGSAASITGSISGTGLTVTALSSGTLAPGQLLQGSGLQLGTGITIVSQSGGSVGGTGAYVISISQGTVPSQTFTATTLLDDITMNINQAPTVSASNIYLALL